MKLFVSNNEGELLIEIVIVQGVLEIILDACVNYSKYYFRGKLTKKSIENIKYCSTRPIEIQM